ncbi:twin-arginine translocase subunit TatC [Paenibacillus montanisoli]|uniref:Sec-independent protein translocase protein TatC n=1 Tax=Paenibacillus montanisoli TaxID=2081970 RepID=A0A328TWG5_9BACL|nr:twin-arginine translocase subunit TatC [Paenibacillus montanisoli]RAP73883.1 twin-arginine translocase subunit TatC [Paenibacillus montanisoli]
MDESQAREAARGDQPMTLLDHIGELRRRIIIILVILVLGMVLGLVLADPVYKFMLNQEPVKGMKFYAFSLWDGIGMYMKFALVIALIFALPTAAYQLWAFVKPALGSKEQRAALLFVPFVLIMFLVGLAFSYYVVFPMAFNFTTDVAKHLNLEENYGVIQYFTFLFNILIPISLLFELPIVIMFLTKLRIVNPLRLKKMRRLAYFLLIIVGIIVTPPDFISDALVAIPLILLYELSVMLSGVVYKKQLQADRAWEEEYGT